MIFIIIGFFSLGVIFYGTFLIGKRIGYNEGLDFCEKTMTEVKEEFEQIYNRNQ